MARRRPRRPRRATKPPEPLHFEAVPGEPIWCPDCAADIRAALADLEELAALLSAQADGHRPTVVGERVTIADVVGPDDVPADLVDLFAEGEEATGPRDDYAQVTGAGLAAGISAVRAAERARCVRALHEQAARRAVTACCAGTGECGDRACQIDVAVVTALRDAADLIENPSAGGTTHA